MAYLTFDEARRLADSAEYRSGEQARSELKKAAAAGRWSHFDIFLSHAYIDQKVIWGIYNYLRTLGLEVYLDWIDDADLDRNHVTARTAGILRTRMQNSESLIYASSEGAQSSVWMPWELGYFDGHRPGYASVLPLLEHPGDQWTGREYLGLYPIFEVLRLQHGNDLAIETKSGQRRTASQFAKSGGG